MSVPQTESSDMKVWKEQQWKVMPPLSIPVAVEAPAQFVDLRTVELEQTVPSDFILIWPRREQSLDTITHRTLLEKSLREYSDIWRKLAEV